VEPDVAAFLEELIEAGLPWDDAGLADLSDRLTVLPSPVADLAGAITRLRVRLAAGHLPESLCREVEAVVYPRWWKVLEAVRAGLPEGEQRIRVQVLDRRLDRLFARQAEPV
jgi:hypothetical protein